MRAERSITETPPPKATPNHCAPQRTGRWKGSRRSARWTQLGACMGLKHLAGGADQLSETLENPLTTLSTDHEGRGVMVSLVGSPPASRGSADCAANPWLAAQEASLDGLHGQLPKGPGGWNSLTLSCGKVHGTLGLPHRPGLWLELGVGRRLRSRLSFIIWLLPALRLGGCCVIRAPWGGRGPGGEVSWWGRRRTPLRPQPRCRSAVAGGGHRAADGACGMAGALCSRPTWAGQV
jgi:hypothetical protein